MRIIGRALFLLFALLVGAWLASIAWPRIALHLAGGSLFVGEDVRTASAYLLPIGRDVEFVLARQPSRARIAVAALVPPAAALPADATWRLAWTAIGERGTVIDSGTFDGGCRAPPTWADKDGRLHPTRWSVDADLAPCADQLLFLRFNPGENAARILLRLESADASYRGITVRIVQRVARSRVGGAVAWHRMSDATRADLARFQAYPSYLLTPSEITAVTASEWTSVGPQGVAGDDFGVTTIAYLPADIVERDPASAGITHVADAARHLTLPVFESGEVVLRLTPATAGADVPIDARVTFHPTLPWAPSTLHLKVPPEGIEWRRPLDRGLVEIAADVPLTVDILAADTATMQHEKHRLRVLQLDDGETIDWPVSHVGGVTTALRLDVRGFVDNTGPRTRENDALSWQWLDARGRVLRSGGVAPSLLPSLYDLPERDGIVTDPASVWFRLPDDVATLRVIAHGKLLANAWSRIDESTLPRRVPAEQRAWFDDARRVPEWFGFDPADWTTRVSSGKTTLLRIQHRPLPPTRLGADVLVDVMAPRESSALAARIVMPLAAVPFKLAPQAGRLYAPLDNSCHAQIVAARGEVRVAPQLLFTGGKGMAPVTVVLDGLPLDIPSPAGDNGTIDLPPLAAGSHRVCVVDRTGRHWYTSNASLDSARLIEGGGYRLETGSAFTFDVHKGAAPLTLNVRWYGSDRAATTPVLDATVEGIPARGNFTGYTIRHIRWSMPAATNRTLPGSVLYRAGARTAAPQAMNITLDTDLPAGTYRVRFALTAGNPGYLGISRLEYVGESATSPLYEVP